MGNLSARPRRYRITQGRGLMWGNGSRLKLLMSPSALSPPFEDAFAGYRPQTPIKREVLPGWLAPLGLELKISFKLLRQTSSFKIQQILFFGIKPEKKLQMKLSQQFKKKDLSLKKKKKIDFQNAGQNVSRINTRETYPSAAFCEMIGNSTLI